MTRVTRASIAYVATQVRQPICPETSLTPSKVRFSLSSSSVFSKTDTATDSERFCTSVLDLLDDPDEVGEDDSLMEWWDR
jgi:hypothetical protein